MTKTTPPSQVHRDDRPTLWALVSHRVRWQNQRTNAWLCRCDRHGEGIGRYHFTARQVSPVAAISELQSQNSLAYATVERKAFASSHLSNLAQYARSLLKSRLSPVPRNYGAGA